MNFSRVVLGLDLGVTSIGWALIKTILDESGIILSIEIIASGVRIFPATTEGTQNTPKNFGRRLSRAARRLLRRKRQRKNNLRELLVSNRLLPEFETGESSEKFDALGNPYGLRVRGLEEKLSEFEIGRAIYHLAKRRGFLSNRKSSKSKDEGVVLSGIAKIKAEIGDNQFKTLGQYLSVQEKQRKHYTAREMVKDEFEQFWSAQSRFYPEILTENLKNEIEHIVFYQRPIASQRGAIGKCAFEKGKKRCDSARQAAQRVRYRQDLNNLKIQSRRTLDWRDLRLEEKLKLADELEKRKELDIERIPKLLKIASGARINLSGSKTKIFGNKTAYAFRKAVGKTWDALGEEKQDCLTEDFFRIESELSLQKRLREHWNFTDEQIEKLLKVELESGHSRLSLKAINKILPLMKEGLRYDEACKQIYGDHRKAFGKSSEKLELPPKDLRNPIVYKALCELRKVAGEILREYGKPDEIRIEMARDLKMTAVQKENFLKRQLQNKRANEEAAEFYKKKFGLETVSGFDKLKYRLWKEASEQCPYTGEKIPPEILLDDNQVDVEHIIPYSRCFDDSFMNKTICLARFNREDKKNFTPYELFGGSEQKYFEVLERVKNFPFGKRRKFEMKNVDEIDWIGRQLSDTRYICREARGYLRQLYPHSADENKYVQVVSGGSTALLRRVWGLNSILADGDVEEKNRADHRHHAIDAIVIALTDRALFQNISKLAGQNRDRMRRILSGMETPWENFLSDVSEAINRIVVSHAPTHRVRGALLEETAYGAAAEEGLFVVRKNLESLTKSNIEKGEIVDKAIREIVKARYDESGGDLKKAFVEPLLHRDGKTPIKRVRVYVRMSPETVVGIKDKSGKPYKYYALGGNHHVEIFENVLTEERKAVLVSRFQAAENIRDSIKRGNAPSPVIGKLDENHRFLFSLCPNDYIEFLGDDGKLRLYRIQKMSGGKNLIVDARPLEDARSDYIVGVSLRISGRGFRKITRKLQVDPLGHLAQAND